MEKLRANVIYGDDHIRTYEVVAYDREQAEKGVMDYACSMLEVTIFPFDEDGDYDALLDVTPFQDGD